MLRLRFPGAALLLTLAAANPLVAQTPAAPVATQPTFSESHLKAARDVVIGSGIAASFEGIYPEFITRMNQSLGTTRPEVLKDLDVALKSIKGEADKRIDEMVMSSARIFADMMPEADLKQVAAFYTSEVGKKFNTARPAAIDRIFNVLQPWSMKTSEDLYNVLRTEMKKKGHDI
jgi:uncharacterized protein